MKAACYDRYGPPEVVTLREVEKPTPRPGELLVRVRATTVSSGDHRARSLELPPGFGPVGRLMFGLSRPRQPILGADLAGDVEAVGSDVRSFRVGDAVLGYPDTGLACHAEYRCLPERGAVIPKPAHLGYEEAVSLLFGGVTALHFLGAGKVKRGEQVLVNGASGAVGTACVQLARHLGAVVTAVCSGANAERVRSLGASHVVDYTREDFVQLGRTWDVVVDVAGTAPFPRCRGVLAPGGRLLLVLAGLPDMLLSPWRSLVSGRRNVPGVALGSREALLELAALAEAGAIVPVIDEVFPLDRIVDAHRRVATGHKRGAVVVAVPGPGRPL